MAIVINGSGTVTGLAVGGLPDGTVDADTVAADVATQAELDLKANIANFTSTGIDDNATSTAITIDSNENVGIGVTPESDWGSRNVLQFGLGASISGRTSSVDLEVSRNAKYTGNNPTSTGKYINADQACMYRQNGDHSFHVAPSGTADAAITWTEALTITNDGRGLSEFTAKAWVNFNGTGTVAIRDSHNVSSITDNGTGHYSINFANNMANDKYVASGMSGIGHFMTNLNAAQSVGNITVYTVDHTGSNNNKPYNYLMVFGA